MINVALEAIGARNSEHPVYKPRHTDKHLSFALYFIQNIKSRVETNNSKILIQFTSASLKLAKSGRLLAQGKQFKALVNGFWAKVIGFRPISSVLGPSSLVSGPGSLSTGSRFVASGPGLVVVLHMFFGYGSRVGGWST